MYPIKIPKQVSKDKFAFYMWSFELQYGAFHSNIMRTRTDENFTILTVDKDMIVAYNPDIR